MKTVITLILAMLMSTTAFAQQKSIIKGMIKTADTEMPIAGVTVTVLASPNLKTQSQTDGTFILLVPVGIYDISFSHINYANLALQQIRTYTGKDVALDIKLTNAFSGLQEVTIISKRKPNPTSAANAMSLVGSVSFNSELTERFAGTFGDPARMVTSYAGVAAPGDQRNDISVRGNAPNGLLWRLEGMNIPSPNHFSAAGTTGGAISILNNNLIKKSDFFLSAFLPEYGNAYSGVFDVSLRDGNADKFHGTGQIGFAGFEADLEGPLNKDKKSSFLVAYRYSTPKIFDLVGIPIIKGAVPRYQDLTFKINFPASKGGKISIWGIGGNSTIDLLNENIKNEPKNGYTSTVPDNSNVYFGSKVGILGVNFERTISRRIFLKTGILGSYNQTATNVDSLQQQQNLFYNQYQLNAQNYGIQLKSEVLGKLSDKTSFKTGFFIDVNGISLDEKSKQNTSNINPKLLENDYLILKNTHTFGLLTLQPYAQAMHRIGNKIIVSAGANLLYLGLNGSLGLDPRINASWQIAGKTSLNFGYGIHHKSQPMLAYYASTNIINPSNGKREQLFSNKNLKLSRNDHYVIGFNWTPTNRLRVKADTYYQKLSKIPVSKITENRNTDAKGINVGGGQSINPAVYSTLNTGTSFNEYIPDSLQSTGTGENYGLEITLEKTLHNGFYLLTSGSLFSSTYTAADQTVRNTTQNVNYIVNLSTGYEYKLKPRNSNFANSLFADINATLNGGKPYRSVLEEASANAGYIIYDDANIYSKRFSGYRNINLKIGLRHNRPKTSHYWALEFKNLLNTPNLFGYAYNIQGNNVVTQRQLQQGFMWVITYRINI